MPQFIDVEDKIFGPITTRQFIILLVAAFFIFLEFKLFDFTSFVLLGVLTATVAMILAFFKVNGMPVHYFLLNFIQSFKRAKVRIWRKEVSEAELRLGLHKPMTVIKSVTAVKPPLEKSRLTQLSMLVDTGGMYRGEEEILEKPKS
ncbi:MAG: PrgI family protein [Candidatus Kerfeldbacteria bacterium]|nr:PrgI family protein [Candidatus Kerfeldbacteria bacterium]